MLAGPNARQILAGVTHGDVSNDAFPFLSVRRMELEAATDAIVLRVSFSGELGYEIYTPAMYQAGLYDALLRAGADLGLVPAGSRALASLRIEKAFKSWGLDLAPDYTVMETGMDRFVDWKRSGFIGEEAARGHRAQGAAERFVTLTVDADDADCSGGEPVFRDDVYVGYVTSGAYGYATNESLALGYLRSHVVDDRRRLRGRDQRQAPCRVGFGRPALRPARAAHADVTGDRRPNPNLPPPPENPYRSFHRRAGAVGSGE